MKKNYSVLNLVLSFFLCVVTTLVFADPPSQVIRLGYMDGTVSFSPAGVDQWVYATKNRPIVTGDKLWADVNSKSELQLGSAVIRMNQSTSINILNIQNNSPQIELDQGTVNLHIWKMSRYKGFEIDTPNLALTVDQAGDYRLDVDPINNTTTVTVRDGMAVVYGENNSYQINAGESFTFSGTQLAYEALAINEPDVFDKWCMDRNALYNASIAKRYVSMEVIGSTDLDSYGQWTTDSSYGTIWYPTIGNAKWAPYSQGQWVWIEPWGWTWQDDQPWGFAPFHYGRWVYSSQGWGWIPGPIEVEPVYAPALVAFYQDSNFDVVAGGAIGWFPLGPQDVYVPAYSYSQEYFTSINISNTTINQTIINNVYNDPHQTFAYSNLQAPHAVTAISTKAFVASQPTLKAGITVPKSAWAKSRPSNVAAVVPSNTSVVGTTKIVTTKPSAKVLAKPVIAKTAPPAAPIPFAKTKALLVKSPGKPLSTSTTLKPTANPNVSQVKVVKGHSAPTPISGKQSNKVITTPATSTSPSVAPHPKVTPQVIHKPSTTGKPRPVVINPNPQVVHPKPVKPQVVHPKPVNPQVVHPKPASPQVVHPKPASPQVVHPKPASPQVVHPKPASPQVVHPKPASPHQEKH